MPHIYSQGLKKEAMPGQPKICKAPNKSLLNSTGEKIDGAGTVNIPLVDMILGSKSFKCTAGLWNNQIECT